MANNNNLGHKVTSRTVNWGQKVREAWGEEWGERDTAYDLESADRHDTDNTKSGVYGIVVVTGILLQPQTDLHSDMPIRLMTETYNMIGIDK